MESNSTTNDRVHDVFGCDIGNGFGFISILKDTKSDPMPMFPTKYKLDSVGMPTSAYITPPSGTMVEVFDGRPAYDKHRREPEKFLHAVKTRLKEGTVQIPGISAPVSTDSVYAAIARDLIKLGNEQRKNRGESPIYDIVFTFPATFTSDVSLLNRMQKSIEGIRVDGTNIKVVGRLPEPAAVAIDYLYYMQNIAPENVRLSGSSYTTLVYDLGHGTFDAAVVTARSKGEPYQLHINAGLPDVGGKNFDDILYDEICRILKAEYGYVPKNSNARETIRLVAIEMKHELTDSEISCHSITLSDGELAEVEITRSKFEEKSRALINQTFELVESIMQQAGEDNIHIDAVVLSGGASQMPMVTDGLNQLLSEEKVPVFIYRPSEAVSYGAARYAFGRSIVPQPQPKQTPKPQPQQTPKLQPKAEPKVQIQPCPSEILEKFTEYCYGIWLPSKLSGFVKFMVKSKEKLPAGSKSIRITSSSSRVVLKLYRSLEKYVLDEESDIEQCASIMHIPFDVPVNTECEVKIVVLEDYNIKVICKPADGETIEKSTMDLLWKLV